MSKYTHTINIDSEPKGFSLEKCTIEKTFNYVHEDGSKVDLTGVEFTGIMNGKKIQGKVSGNSVTFVYEGVEEAKE